MENNPISGKAFQEDKFLNALADNFRLQEAIINATQLAIISTSTEGIINSFNRSAEQLLGYNAVELIEKASPVIFFDVEEIVRNSEGISFTSNASAEPLFEVFTNKLSADNLPYRAEWKIVRKDSSSFPASVSFSALREDDDSLIGFVIIIEDISETKVATERAAASEEKFQLLAENIPGVIYLCKNDKDYSMVYLNDMIEVITGIPAQQFIDGKVTFASLMHPEDAKLGRVTVDEALENHTSFHVEYRVKHVDGSWRWVEEVGVGVYHGGRLDMIEGFIMDVTLQKSVQEQIHKIAEENLHVFNNPVNLNAIAGFDGYFKRVSPSWETLLGWTPEELLEKPFISFVHPDDFTTTREVARYVAEGNMLTPFENRYRCKDGSYKWLLWGAASDVNSLLIYASAIDITERKKSEEDLLDSKRNMETVAIRLQEQNRQLDEFAHIISHNLRSPIGNIQALINLLGQDSTIADYQLIFEKLKNVSKNLGDTMNDLMDTIKVRENINIERTELKFKEVLDKVVQTLEGDLIRAEASITFDFNDATTIHYPKAYLESIFQNLLSNGLKYRSPKRKPLIHFHSTNVRESIELRVSDNGLGIDLEKFGDKLFGLHKTFHHHEEARGVGLFLVKTQIEAMGGTINVESEVDTGTTFIIRF
ncbi:MAG TPA: PAS domain-containing sensor histidine kinase [Chryseosolibacter sp.]|nr:PAS domain-containing sensor histidine kinase [Chryseosolibacter sp.]